MRREHAGHPAEGGFREGDGAADRLRSLLRYAVLAPSRHNTQPWIFEIEGDEVRVFADASRALPAADPDGRQLLMACGAALVNLRVAAQHFGHTLSVETMPAHRADGLVARVRLEERWASTPEAEAMFRAIPLRRTNRLPLDGREPPDGLLTALLREARREHVSLRVVEERERRAVSEIVAEGDRLQWASGRFRAELAAWTRSNSSSRQDGLPGYSYGMSDAAAFVHPLAVRFAGTGRAEADRDRRRAIGTKALLVLSTPDDAEAGWIAAGEALQRVLLRATCAGLYASYFSQVIELPDLRHRLREAIGERGAPQIMFRLGYGLEVRAPPRRPVEGVLRAFAATPARPQPLALRAPPLALPRPGIL
ncbi:Acg family FMN-binding oxidoreductase, partial [Anaeromyxobacter sp. SG26]